MSKNAFTHLKKRAKQREEYLQKREEILSNNLSEENKAGAQARYEANPEQKKAAVRKSYTTQILNLAIC